MLVTTQDSDLVKGDRCPVCLDCGRQSRLKLYQLNLEDAVLMCPNKKCSYPFGTRSASSVLLKRKASDVANIRRRRGSLCSVDQSSCSSSRSTSPVMFDRILSPPVSIFQSQPKPCIQDLGSSLSSISSISNLSVSGSLESWGSGGTQLELNLSEDHGLSDCCENMEGDWSHTAKGVLQPRDVSKDILVGKLHTPENQPNVAPIQFVQWKNRYALCWLDVVLCLLIHCYQLRRFVNDHRKGIRNSANSSTDIMHRLLTSYSHALQLVNKHHVDYFMTSQIGKIVNLETSVGTVAVKTGGGDAVYNSAQPAFGFHNQNPSIKLSAAQAQVQFGGIVTPKVEGHRPLPLMTDSSHQGMDAYHDPGTGNLSSAAQILEDVREEVWQVLHPKLQCQKGENDSPVFALPLILRHAGSTVEDLFWVKYTWCMTCSSCGFRHSDRVEKTLPTFPQVPADFSMGNSPYFLRDCFRCHAQQQRMRMKIDSFPPVLVIHFVEGLGPTTPDLQTGTFQMEGHHYDVTGMVQYRNSPDHFVSWLRDPVVCSLLLDDFVELPVIFARCTGVDHIPTVL